MKRISTIITAVSTLSLLSFTARAQETVRPQTTPAQSSERGLDQAERGERLGQAEKVRDLIGMEVKNPQNEKLGKVENLIVDLPAGRVTMVIISSGGFLGLGDELSAVPPGAFRYSPERKTLVLDSTKEALAAAPHFKANQWPDVNQSSYQEKVYRAYRVEPYPSSVTTRDADNTARNVRDRDG